MKSMVPLPLAGVLTMLLTAAAWTQAPASAAPSADASPVQQQETSTSLPLGERVNDPQASLTDAEMFRVLQENPDALIEVKSVVAEYLTQQGTPTQADSISDDTLYMRLRNSPELRGNVAAFLRSRGYLNDGPANDSLESNPPTGNAIPPRAATESTTSRATKETDTAEQRRTSEAAVSLEPQVLRRPAPYNLMALRDLYSQLPQPSQPLKRFGSDMFQRRGTGTANAAPSVGSTTVAVDLPIGPDYVLGTGDSLTITLWGGVSQSFTRTIDGEGRVLLPEAGAVQVAGLSLERAQALITEGLRRQYRDVQIAVAIARTRSIRIYVVGDVQRPGAYELSSLSTPINALYAAGGPTAVGSLRIVRHYRGERLLAEIDLYDFLLRGIRYESRLQSGDTLLVPPAGAQVAVDGAIKRPAIYETKGETSLSSLIVDAGGPTSSAETGRIRVERITAGHERETINLSLDATGSAFLLRDGDHLHVGSILPYSSRVIYTEGHVLRPGRTAYQDGMKITDVLRSYQDLLPEPADRGEIVRLLAPDLHPQTIEFSVADVLAGNNSLSLQPFDTIRVFGRYEVDAPRVTIAGEVLRPGVYPLTEGMTTAQLVRTAGGFKRDALLEKADLTSYKIVDGSRVISQRSTVRIGAAVQAGEAAADVSLRPGDVLTVHQIAGWNDIGSSIVLEGEVAHPGSYGIQQGERLSSILRRAGGFRETAYAPGAVLLREEVRVLEEKSRQELIRQIETSSSAARLAPAVSASDQASVLQVIQQQQEQVLGRLKSQPATGRLVIHISQDIASWEGTPADIEVRAGDTLRIPKQPGFILVNGQVYNPTAMTFTQGKNAAWYLRRAGGTTEVANQKQIFIIRANGSVVGRESGFLERGVLGTKLERGDVVVVPQKILGASLFWRNLLTTAQLASSIAITAAVAGLL